MAWEAGAVRRHERQAEHFPAFAGTAAAERVARRVEQDAYIILRLEVRRRPQGKSILDG